MKTAGLREAFARDGFVVVPSVLSAGEVLELRSYLDSVFETTRRAVRRMLVATEVLQHPPIYRTLFRDPVIRSLAEVLGTPFTIFSDLTVPRNLFGRPGEIHCDCDSEGKQPYLLRRDYRFVKCGIYLQDNDPEWGGGVTLVPGAHRFPLKTPSIDVTFKLKRLRDRAAIRTRERWANLKAGDLLFFDSRLPHQSAFPSRYTTADLDGGELPLPRERTKYVIYWDASATDTYVDAFLANAVRRGATEAFYNDFAQLVFPDDYPAEFIELARSAGVKVASLRPADAALCKQRHPALLTANG